MRKHTKVILFVATAVFNILFLKLCGYGAYLQPHTSGAIEPFFGAVTVVLLGCGEVSVIQQLYLKDKYRSYTRRLFDYKLWKQCIALVLFYAFAIVLVASVEYVYGVFYVAIAALVLSAFYVTGSKTLWIEEGAVLGVNKGEMETANVTREANEASEAKVIGYYLADLGKLYEVKGVMENEDVVEMLCQAIGDRERTITIAKKKQKLAQ